MEELLKQNQNSYKIDRQHPFMGLHSYEEENKTQFGGRNNEVKELFNLSEANRLTIVFGKSGIGKTSLIKAGLIPVLQNNYFFPIYLRIDYSSVKTPLNQAKESIYEKLRQRDGSVPLPGDQTLWEYFSTLKLLDGLIIPVLIFDQFEEIFTIGKEKRIGVQEFIIELSDLAENRVPIEVQEREGHKSALPGLNYDERNLRVIISLREDYLANLESLKNYLPSIRNSRFRVLQMTALQAMDAVLKPAGNLIDQATATAIVKKLPGITDLDFVVSPSSLDNNKRYLVEPFLLSLICYEINEKRIESGMEKITPELVAQFDITDVINAYYNKTMMAFNENVQWGIEDSLLTESGFRKLQSVEELEKGYYINEGIIQQLVEKRIIRKEKRDGVEYVELIHDVLSPVIKASRDKRINDRMEKEKMKAIEKAIELDRGKIKKMVIKAFLFMVPVLLGIIAYKYITIRRENETYKKENETKERKRINIEFANQLLKGASTIYNVYGKDTTAVILSRTAYLINKENGGGNEINFYNSMYNSMSYGVNFTAAFIDNTSINAIINDGNDVFYFSCDNGAIYKKTGVDGPVVLINKFDRSITSLAISPDKKYLAAAGFFNDIKIIDLSHGQKNSDNQYLNYFPPSGERSLCFTSSGKLIVRLDSGIIGWERKLNGWSKISWNQKIFVDVDYKRQMITKSQATFTNKNYFTDERSLFKCMAVYGDKIALGLDSGLILLTGDSVISIRSTDIFTPTAIAFDPTGKYLFMGDDAGNMNRISLTDYVTVFRSVQYTSITGITFSGDGHYMATASIYGSIGFWDLEKGFSSESTLALISQNDISDNEDKAKVNCIAADKNGEFILAGYSNGAIYKRPVSLKILSKLICSYPNFNMDTLILKKVLKNDLDMKQMEKYNCKNYPEN